MNTHLTRATCFKLIFSILIKSYPSLSFNIKFCLGESNIGVERLMKCTCTYQIDDFGIKKQPSRIDWQGTIKLVGLLVFGYFPCIFHIPFFLNLCIARCNLS